MDRLPARAQLGAGCQRKVPIIIMDEAVQKAKVNSLEKFSPLANNEFRQQHIPMNSVTA